MLVESLNWRACRCPSKDGTVLPKVALLATVVASAITLHAWAGTPQMRVPTYVALHSPYWGEKLLDP